jgi:hypothetical protein
MPERPEDFEEAWARIVADLTAESDQPDGPRAVADATGDPGPTPREERAPDEPPAAPGTPEAGLASLFEPLRRAQAEASRGTDPGAFVDNWEDEGHYTPPPPPELPEGTPAKRLAWAGLLGGPTTLILIALTGWDAPRVVGIAAGLATLAGFVTLVWLLPEGREDGWDDGARL